MKDARTRLICVVPNGWPVLERFSASSAARVLGEIRSWQVTAKETYEFPVRVRTLQNQSYGKAMHRDGFHMIFRGVMLQPTRPRSNQGPKKC